MVLPIGDRPNVRAVPVVTYLLIAANVAVYALVTLPLERVRPDPGDPALAHYLRTMTQALGADVVRQLAPTVSAYDLFVFAHGFRPAAPSASALLFAMFLHGGFLHLAGNMLFLWIYGDNVEHRLGRLRYLAAYLGTGVAATLFHMGLDRSSPIPMVGASGAISGVLGFYFLWFPHNAVRLLALLPPFLMDVFEVPARLVLGLYLLADNLLPYLVDRSPSGVAHAAHIGGFVAGLGAAWALDRRTVAGRPVEYRHVTAAAPRDPADVRRAIAAGRYADAATEYFALPTAAARGQLDPEAAHALAGWLRENGHVDAALVALERSLRDFPDGPGAAATHVLAGHVLLDDSEQAAAAYQHFVDALRLHPDADTESAARRGIARIAALQKRTIGHPHRRPGWSA